jgi:predicted amidohydrolase
VKSACRLIAQAAASGARLVVLPEYFCLMGRRDDDKLRAGRSGRQRPIQQALAGAARQHGLWVVGGTLPLQGSDRRTH